jgi:hypothetical protein
MKIRVVGGELFHAGGRADRKTDMTKLNSRFSQCCHHAYNAPLKMATDHVKTEATPIRETPRLSNRSIY